MSALQRGRRDHEARKQLGWLACESQAPSIPVQDPSSARRIGRRLESDDDDTRVPRVPRSPPPPKPPILFPTLPKLLQAITKSKGRPLRLGLERFTLTHWPATTPTEPSVLALIEEAKGVRLKIEIEVEVRRRNYDWEEVEEEKEVALHVMVPIRTRIQRRIEGWGRKGVEWR